MAALDGDAGAAAKGPSTGQTPQAVSRDRDLPLDPSHPSDLTARFAASLRRAEADQGLDEACALVAAHFRVGADADGTDLTAVRAELDALATGVPAPTVAAVVTHLAASGWGGDPSDYATPDGSMLPSVLQRRRGLPILLSVVTVEVARRVGAPAAVVGMPGHVLVTSVGGPRVLADPFHGRSGLSQDEARGLFARIHGSSASWDPSFLAPVDGRQVVARILANLANRYRADRNHRCEAVALGLRSLVPGVGVGEQAALASALARSGAFDRAAVTMEELADAGGAGADPGALRDRATRWRARLN